jgi:hypothetical protein
MRSVHVGRLLLALGLLVGLAASVGLLVGFEPSRLPPALLDLAAYKLTYLAALGLLAGGAVFLRHARRADAPEATTTPTERAGRVLARAHEARANDPRLPDDAARLPGNDGARLAGSPGVRRSPAAAPVSPIPAAWEPRPTGVERRLDRP